MPRPKVDTPKRRSRRQVTDEFKAGAERMAIALGQNNATAHNN